MMQCLNKILLPIFIAGVFLSSPLFAQVDQFEYERPNLNFVAAYGDGKAGYVDGTLEKARFNRPMGAAFYSESLMLVADTYNRKIRAVHFGADKVETVECHPEYSEDCNSEFVFPVDVSCSQDGYCLVLDAGDGSIATILLEETLYIRSRYYPLYDNRRVFKGALGIVCHDRSSTAMVASTYENMIWYYSIGDDSPDPLFGTGEPGYDEKETDARLSRLNNPTSMVGIGNSVMILDSRNAMIKEVDMTYSPNYVVSVFSGGGPFEYLTQKSDLGQVYDFGLPFRMTYSDFQPGIFFISIPSRNQVVALTFERQAYVVVGQGSKGYRTIELNKPYAIAALKNRFVVFDGGNHMRVYSIKRDN